MRLSLPRCESPSHSSWINKIGVGYDPDLSDESLRGNVVLRWRYHRGSTLFAAWNLSRSDEAGPGRSSAVRDLGDAFGGEGSQVFMLKFNRG